jgi:HD-GYP domain-containing protein (c-di-GMP phosphodiesterase class II)
MDGKDLIDVDALKVGMFIHLDLGWMRHPFPLSSFRISSEEQIGILRKLGLRQVRWSPSQSQLKSEEQPASASKSGAAELTPEQQVAAARRVALLRQREALGQCEAQYAEAAKVLGEVNADLQRAPAKAGALARDLCRSLLDKMLVEGDVSLRLLTEAAGDRACAHGLNVSLVGLLLGRASGMNETELLDLGVGALLHDMGKLEIEPRLRHRSEQFSSAELAGYQWHVTKGVEMGQRAGLTAPSLCVVAQHHEQADGKGFPQKLLGDKVHPAARVVALVNRFDGLCNPALPGVKGMTPHEALSLMFAQGRSRFDATLLNAFIRMMGVYPPGSAVQLTDERYALVVAVNANRPLKPTVLIHDPAIPSREALLTSLEEQPNLGIRRSLRAQDLPDAARDYLRPRARLAYFPQAERPATD